MLLMMVVCSEESCEILEEMDHRNTFVLVFSSLCFCSFRVLGVLWILQQEPIGDLFPLIFFMQEDDCVLLLLGFLLLQRVAKQWKDQVARVTSSTFPLTLKKL